MEKNSGNNSRNTINNPYCNIMVNRTEQTQEIENNDFVIEENDISQLRQITFNVVRRLFKSIKEEDFLDLNGSEL